MQNHVKFHVCHVVCTACAFNGFHFCNCCGHNFCTAVVKERCNTNAFGIAKHIKAFALFGVHHNFVGVKFVPHTFKLKAVALFQRLCSFYVHIVALQADGVFKCCILHI